MNYEAELETLVGKLQRAAIDAWMIDSNPHWNILEDYYEITSSSSSATVTRPNSIGLGGGDWSGDFEWLLNNAKDAEFSTAFDEVRQVISSLIEPWSNLPDPNSIEDYVENCRVAVSHLVGESWNDGEHTRPAIGELRSSLEMIKSDSMVIRGATGDSFRKNFLQKMDSVADNLLGVAIFRGGAVSAQKGLWESARGEVLNVVRKAISTFDAVASGGAADFQYKSSLVGWVLEGIKIFASSFVKKGIDVLLWTDKAPSAPNEVRRESSSYADALDALRVGLKTISTSIRDEEEYLFTLIKNHIELYQSKQYRSGYDVTPDSIEPEDVKEDWITIDDPSRVESIANTFLPAVAVELNTAADLNSACAELGIVMRSPMIGYGLFGPMSKVIELNELLHKLLEDLAAEALWGAVQLKEVLTDFQETEEQIIANLNRVAAEIVNGGIDYEGEDLQGDLSNIAKDRVKDPLYGQSAAAKSPLQQMMSGDADAEDEG